MQIITFAAVNGTMPVRLLQIVASGLLGQSAYEGYRPIAILGRCLHLGLSYLWAVNVVAGAFHYPRLVRGPALAETHFGIGFYLAMNKVMLPLSAFPHPGTFKQPGVPIAIAAATAIRQRESA